MTKPKKSSRFCGNGSNFHSNLSQFFRYIRYKFLRPLLLSGLFWRLLGGFCHDVLRTIWYQHQSHRNHNRSKFCERSINPHHLRFQSFNSNLWTSEFRYDCGRNLFCCRLLGNLAGGRDFYEGLGLCGVRAFP